MTVAMDAMAVAIHIKYALSLNRHLTFYLRFSDSCTIMYRHFVAYGVGRRFVRIQDVKLMLREKS